MMVKKIISKTVWILLILGQTFFSQEVKNEAQKPYSIGLPSKVEHVQSISSRKNNLVRPDLSSTQVMLDGRSSKYEVVIGKGSVGDDVLAIKSKHLRNKIPSKTPELVFDTGASSSQPTDPSGAVGPNHYISVINTAFQIFDKNGVSLTDGLLSPNPTIFPTGGCCDLTASYDNVADRWVLSFLGGGVQVAVSDGPDPINDDWTVYTFADVADYQKLSVWRDGYYMTENTNNSNKLHVFERAAMIDAASAGTTPQILSFSLPGLVTSGFHSPQVLNISNNDWPTTGGATVVYMQDDAWPGVTSDHIKLWNVDIDWTNPDASTVSAASEITTTSFVSVFDGGSFTNLAQPNGGGDLDALQATIMNQAQYRKFPNHNSAVFNFVVDVDGSSVKQAGIRWYELRQTADGEPWTIFQEGTYTAPDNRHAWNASLIMDAFGNIGMGYTGMASSNSSDPSVVLGSYYTGRFSDDPLNSMTITEETIKAGDANIPGTRYGDYSKIDIDPANDKKFWFVNEVMSGGRKNVAGVFQIAPNFSNDIGVVSIDNLENGVFSSTENITVTIHNFGENSASGFNVTYQINGGSLITEAYTETIASNTSKQFTFTTTADLSTEGQLYSITSSVNFIGDENTSNDSKTIEVRHISAKDLGVTAITAPVGAESLENESVVITIKNFGSETQSNFDVSYSVNGGNPVIENVVASLAPENEMSYTFSTLGNFSEEGLYEILGTTLLVDDTNASNNSSSVEIRNLGCKTEMMETQQPFENSGATTSVITMTKDVLITDMTLTLNISHPWISDVKAKLIGPGGAPEVILFENLGAPGDQNFTNTTFNQTSLTSISDGSAPFTGSFKPQQSFDAFYGLMSAGDWTLSITESINSNSGILQDWSLQICSRTSLSVSTNELEEDFKILNKGNNQYEIVVKNTQITEDLDLSVYNILGQKLLWKTLKKSGGVYSYELDMSYASKGVYLIRLGQKNKATVKRIIIE